MKYTKLALITLVCLWLLSSPTVSLAGEADVVGVKASVSGDGTWSFSVTVKHADEGWDHYADKWEVLGPDGEVLGTRVLLHPHVGEQPFTRSLGGVKIPIGVKDVVVRAHDLVHGYVGKEMEIDLSKE